MISFEVSKPMLNDIQKKLDAMPNKAADVLKKSINATAKQARKKLAAEAQRTYVIKSGRFNKSMTIKNATKSHLEAIIGSTGGVTELKDFKVSPARFSTGDKRPDVVKAKGLRQNSMKRLQKGDLKAFVIKFKSGHLTVAQRLTAKRLPVKVLYSTSLPKMLGNEKKVYGVVEPDIYKDLQNNLNQFISQALEE